MENVRLEKSERTDRLTFYLKNETKHSIYVSYLPPEAGNNTTKFLSYTLERRADGGQFKPYGEGFHFIPSLNPLEAKRMVEFAIIYPPKERGEYRIMVGYCDDETAFRLMREKGSNLTDEEVRQVNSFQRIVRSDVFEVR
jgi:hypothetical protein